MPKKLERRLIVNAHRKGIFKKTNPQRYGAYVYGSLTRIERGGKKKGRR